MTTNQLGIRNNNTIIPYSGATKSTKQLSLVKTTDITAAVVAGTALDAGYTVTTSVRFYADSVGVWKMNIQGRVASGGAGTSRDGLTLTFVKASIKFSATIGGLGTAAPSNGTAYETSTGLNSNTLTVYTNSANASSWNFTADLLLAQEPTDYTTVAANMEGVVAVDVFVPEATATVAGIVGTGAQTIAGVKDFSNGIKLAAGTALTAYEEGTWTPARVGEANITGTPAYGGTNTYTRIGNMVFARISTITGAAITTAGNNTQIRFTSTGLPAVTNATLFYGAASIYIAGGNYEQLPCGINDDAGNSTTVALSIGSHSGVANGESITILSLYFSYSI